MSNALVEIAQQRAEYLRQEVQKLRVEEDNSAFEPVTLSMVAVLKMSASSEVVYIMPSRKVDTDLSCGQSSLN